MVHYCRNTEGVWAVLNGETETGVTLHHMTKYADRGNIVKQEAVPIGKNDTAHDVFKKIIPASGRVLSRSLKDILTGNAEGVPQDESKATKFGRRRPEDGLIKWSKSAREIHNLVRAVTHPFPGAFFYHNDKKVMVWKTRLIETYEDTVPPALTVVTPKGLIEVCEWEVI